MESLYLLNSVWIMLGAILVILMQGGFILLEAGSTRMKNAGHIAGKTNLHFRDIIDCVLGSWIWIYLW